MPRIPAARGPLAEALDRLDGLVDWERRARREAMRQGLAPVRDLLARLGSPEQGLHVVHVGGSKGKGSVAALVAAGLQRAGLRTALYTSPHVERMNERLVVAGREVSDGALARVLTQALDAGERARQEGTAAADASWFDVVTSAAFRHFADAGCDWAVIEVGLGGRLDSTNVLHPRLCVITGVELEHTEVLGTTRAAIAAEKAGILKPGARVVTGLPPAPDEAGAVLDARCAELGLVPRRPESLSELGLISERNTALARLVLDELSREGLPLAADQVDAELQRCARLPGRLERFLARGVPVVLDGAHVAASLSAVLSELAERQGLGAGAVVILGARRDKDLEGLLKTLAGRVDRLLCTTVGTDLHFAPAEIAGLAEQLGLAAETAADPARALSRALELAVSGGGWVLATGSLYLTGVLRPLLSAGPRGTRC